MILDCYEMIAFFKGLRGIFAPEVFIEGVILLQKCKNGAILPLLLSQLILTVS